MQIDPTLHRRALTLLVAAALSPAAIAGKPVTPPGGGPPPDNASTTLLITPTPVALSGDASDDAIADTHTTGTVATSVIDEGKVTIQMYTVAGLPALEGALGGTWTNLAPGNMPPVLGDTSSAWDFDGLGFVPGSGASFRAHYIPGGGQVHADEHKSPSISVFAIGNQCNGALNISADLASGDGDPAPGYSGSWTYRIRLENCTGVDLASIKAQGGTNGWGKFVGYVASKGSTVVKSNKNNEVLTWNLGMPAGTSETLLVTLSGSIPASAACDSIRFLSGPWSATYDAGAGSVKSDYTGRVSVTVTCPAP